MGLFWYTIILLVLLTVYYFSKRSFTEYVQCVESGTNNDSEFLKRHSFNIAPSIIRDENGHILDKNKFVRILVHGDGLKEKDIYNDDILVAEKINTNNLKNLVFENDIIWIYVNETKMDRIMIFDSFEKDTVKTHYSNTQCIFNYDEFQIKGIVRYKL